MTQRETAHIDEIVARLRAGTVSLLDAAEARETELERDLHEARTRLADAAAVAADLARQVDPVLVAPLLAVLTLPAADGEPC